MDVTKLTIKQLMDAMDAGELSSAEATRATLDRIKECEDLGAYVTVCEKEAMAAAERADKARAEGRRAPLLGVPVAVKDNICTEGVRTTCASRFLENYVPPYDAFVVKKLKEAGAVIVGKTNMDEFAMGSGSEYSAFYRVKNAIDPERVAGGSSGGSACAVASGQAFAALGSDTGGSIRQPATFNGVTGLKPTYSAVSRNGLVAFASSLDQIGPIARTADDCRRVYNVIKGHDAGDSTSYAGDLDMGEHITSLKGRRIGIAREFFPDALGGKVREAVEKAIKFYEDGGAEIVETSIGSFDMALACYYIISSAEASSNLSRYDGVKYGRRAEGCKTIDDVYYKSRTQFFGAEVKRRMMLGNFVLSSGYYDAFYLRASKARTLIKRDFEAALSDCDALICPTAPTTAYKSGSNAEDPAAAYLGDVFTVPVNIAGLPALSVKCGEDSDGLPIGMQLIGRQYCEETLLSLAEIYEKGAAK